MFSSVTQNKKNELKRIVGVSFGIAVMVGGTIGVGILRTPGTIAAMLGNYWIIMTCWIIGGIYVLMGAGSYAELAAMLPKAGGAYNYVKKAFGDYPGFLTGWFDYIVNGIAPAYFCIVISEYVVLLIPSLKGNETFIAICLLVAFTILNAGGLKKGSIIQQITSAVKILFFAVFIIACFIITGRNSTNTAQVTAVNNNALGAGIFMAFLRSLQLAMSTYDGWWSVSFFAEEDKNPGKNIPRSLFMGALIVTALYLLINLAILHVVPVSSLANSPLAASDAARVIFGNAGANFVTILSLFSLVSILNTYMLIPARILFGLSRDHFFIKQGTTINGGGTPIVALLISSAMSIILITIGSFQELFSLGAFMMVIVSFFTFASLIKLRVDEPGLIRPYRSWGYPLTTILMLIITVALFVGFAIGDRKNLLIILIITILSYPAFILITRNKKK
jgi:APA family basic amino acid/polyamine antiporter